jgi:RNA polymerase-binding transcription factor DksA
VEERYESELTRSATVLDGVDFALERLSKGSYGTCDTCGSAIAGADLERDPTRRHCEQHVEPTEFGSNEAGSNAVRSNEAASHEVASNEVGFN